MAFSFGELGKTKVHIGISGGRYVEVDMLSVADFSEAQGIMRWLSALNSKADTTDEQRIDAIIKARGDLADIAARVMPEELMDGVRRMEIMDVWKLVSILGTGKDDSEKDDPKKKVVYPSQTEWTGNP